MDRPKLLFNWHIHFDCNYRCPYCFCGQEWEALIKENYFPGTDALLDAWRRIHERYGAAEIRIIGGEPTTYPDFTAIAEGLCRWHKPSMNTNLSFDPTPLLSRAGALRFSMMSFHPASTDLDIFLPKARMVLENGSGNIVSILAWPPLMKDLPGYKQRIEECGLTCIIDPFIGDYEQRPYPESYSSEERELLKRLGKESIDFVHDTPSPPQGNTCNAGYSYALIQPNGDSYRCQGVRVCASNGPFGNIFDPAFALLDCPQPCPQHLCPRDELSFLRTQEAGA